MTFDALAMHAIRDELEANLLGGYVEKVVPLSALEVGLRVRCQRRDFSLLMSADSQSARVHLVGGTLRRLSDDVTPFLLLLRKYVREGRIVSIEQPVLERVLRLAVEKRQEDGTTTASELIIEAMGRRSNVILVAADGKVLDAIKRIPPSISRQRSILPHLPYVVPPAVEKLNPCSPLLARELGAASHQAAPDAALWRFLQETVGGLGPLAAREIVFRAFGDAAVTIGGIVPPDGARHDGLMEASPDRVNPWQLLAETLTTLLQPLETHQWTPCVVVQEGVVTHFAPYLLTQYPEPHIERLGSFSEAVERAYAERLHLRPAEALRTPLRASLGARLERVRRKEDSLRHALTRGEKAEGLKLRGQAILASVGGMAPGQTELLWEDETIALDPHLTPSENAQRYFKEYAKARDATREIPALLDATRLEREYLEQMLTHVELAENEVDLRALSRELAQATERPALDTVGAASRPRPSSRGKPGRSKPDQPAGTVKRITSSDGDQMLVGGSARGNDRVTFDLGTGGDLWLHARGVPGAHVVVKLDGREPSQRTLLEAARLAASRSQARGSSKVPVDYTLQRYVKKVKGGPPGLVTYTHEKTIRVDGSESA